jgi:hypothetical protein
MRFGTLPPLAGEPNCIPSTRPHVFLGVNAGGRVSMIFVPDALHHVRKFEIPVGNGSDCLVADRIPRGVEFGI